MRLLYLIVLAALLTGCGTTSKPDEPETIALTFSNPATPIRVEPDDHFILERRENASVGDDYRIIAGPGESVVRPIDYSWEPEGDLPGSGQVARREFEAVAPGRTAIVFYNCWRGCVPGDRSPGEPIEVFTVEVGGVDTGTLASSDPAKSIVAAPGDLLVVLLPAGGVSGIMPELVVDPDPEVALQVGRFEHAERSNTTDVSSVVGFVFAALAAGAGDETVVKFSNAPGTGEYTLTVSE